MKMLIEKLKTMIDKMRGKESVEPVETKETRRLLPKQVVDAYRKTRIKPIRGSFYDSLEDCGCAMGVYHLSLRPDLTITEFLNQSFDSNYRNAFYRGFDGERGFSFDDQRYFQGYADGLEAWEAVVEAGLVEGVREHV